MSKAGKHCCRLTLLLGGVMAVAAVAVPLAEKVPRPKPEILSKNKPVLFIENRPETGSKAEKDIKEAELPLLGPVKQPASEPQPLELKGVRG
ncbi:MAG: hypothetical protein KJ850_10925 [Gammaproteobacteria bacterium]|nr:hypothetical protein [Gammaproteobacteria bacterium]MBU1625542.1 hypothetical protein [Gammaproteobacteria bacterium]MBU1980802.1 hypothetical protein [Gammaproteobacteria bacterium]